MLSVPGDVSEDGASHATHGWAEGFASIVRSCLSVQDPFDEIPLDGRRPVGARRRRVDALQLSSW